MDRGAWQSEVHGTAKELDMTEQLSTPLKTLDSNLKDGTGAGQGSANFGPNRTASEVRVSFTLLSG